jgi:low affinity Fe/Cu permease
LKLFLTLVKDVTVYFLGKFMGTLTVCVNLFSYFLGIFFAGKTAQLFFEKEWQEMYISLSLTVFFFLLNKFAINGTTNNPCDYFILGVFDSEEEAIEELNRIQIFIDEKIVGLQKGDRK